MKTSVIQSNFLSGVLDPRASARIETDAYNSGLLTGHNIVPVHLGGVRRRGGMRHITQLPNALARVTTGVTVTAPEGGTTANANDDDESTLLTTVSTVGTTDPFVVVHYDLGSAKDIMLADCIGIRSSGGASTEFRIEYSLNDSDWFIMSGSSFELVDTIPRSYRRGSVVASEANSMRYLRVVKVGGTDMGAVTISIAGLNVWQDGGTVSNVRLVPFEVSTEDRYIVAFTDRSATIYEDGDLVALVPTPYVSADIPDLDAAPDPNTMIVVHEDYAPRFLLLEAGDNFQCEQIVFETVPTTDFDDADSPTPTSEVQVITFATYVAGNTFQITLDGARSAAITFAGDAGVADQAATAANIAREIQKLYTVEGFTGVSCARTNTLEYTVTFAGASAGTYELMAVTTVTGTGTATVARSQAGVPRTEAVWSATRGYPRTVTLFGGRLWFGGTRSRQQSIFGSAVSNILDFIPGEGLPDEPIFITLATQSLNAIQGLYAGRSLQVFTTGGEFRFAKSQNEPIVPGDAPTEQTKYGAKKIRPVNIDGATIFIQRTGKCVRDFRFDYEEEAYSSLGVSSLASHLINNAVDLAAWNGSAVDEIGLVFIINGDGTAAVFNSRKEAEVQAWCSWGTQGLFKAVGVVLEDVYFAVRRTINGTAKLFLEILDDDFFTDCGAQTTTFSGNLVGPDGSFTHLIGEELRIRADGFVLASQEPNGSGNIELEITPTTLVEAGLNFNPTVTPMPLNTMTPSGPTFMRKRRIVKVRAKVRNTLGLRCNGRVIDDRQFDVDNFDEAPTPYTGNRELEESTNWDSKDDKLVVFDQVDPCPFELLGIEVQMESSE